MASESTVSSAPVDENPMDKVNIFSQNVVQLPENFEPGQYDVICGRGRKCFNHVGNVRFRETVTNNLKKYSDAEKQDKSNILSEIVNNVRKESPNGGFVKKDATTGRWQAVGDFLAREKTSQAFRDALHDQYKSSNASKKKRRQAEQEDRPFVEPVRSSFGGVDENTNCSQQTYVSNICAKYRRVERYRGQQAALLRALDDDLAAQFGGVRRSQKAAVEHSGLESNEKLVDSPPPLRSTFDIQAWSSEKSPAWFNHSEKLISSAPRTTALTDMCRRSNERTRARLETPSSVNRDRRAQRSELLRMLRSKFLASNDDDYDDYPFGSDCNLVSHGLEQV